MLGAKGDHSGGPGLSLGHSDRLRKGSVDRVVFLLMETSSRIVLTELRTARGSASFGTGTIIGDRLSS